jgi:hypothetical protein
MVVSSLSGTLALATHAGSAQICLASAVVFFLLPGFLFVGALL